MTTNEQWFDKLKEVQDKLDDVTADRDRLKVCPVCDEYDVDGLEACSRCYNDHFKSTIRLGELEKDHALLKAKLTGAVEFLRNQKKEFEEDTMHSKQGRWGIIGGLKIALGYLEGK